MSALIPFVRSRRFFLRLPAFTIGAVSRLKFLIAEDSVQMRRLMRTLLEDMASVVYECASGKEAVRIYFETRPDWVLMDLHMDDGDGLTATREILQRDIAARIVIVTQFDEQELRQAAAEAGAVAYMLKENLLTIRRFLSSPSEGCGLDGAHLSD